MAFKSCVLYLLYNFIWRWSLSYIFDDISANKEYMETVNVSFLGFKKIL